MLWNEQFHDFLIYIIGVLVMSLFIMDITTQVRYAQAAHDPIPECGSHFVGKMWGEDGGWLNFDTTHGEDPSTRIVLYPDGHFEGSAWGPDIGWVNLRASDATHPELRYNFSTHQFTGYGWSNDVGWINFNVSDATHSRLTFSPATELVQGSIFSDGSGWISTLSGAGGDTLILDIIQHDTINPSASILYSESQDGWYSSNDPEMSVTFAASDNCGRGFQSPHLKLYINDILIGEVDVSIPQAKLDSGTFTHTITMANLLNQFPNPKPGINEGDKIEMLFSIKDVAGNSSGNVTEARFDNLIGNDDDDGNGNPVGAGEWGETAIDTALYASDINLAQFGNCVTSPTINWENTTETGSGIRYFEFLVSENQSFTPLIVYEDFGKIPVYSYTFSPGRLQNGHTYWAKIITHDRAGNVRDPGSDPLQNDVTTWTVNEDTSPPIVNAFGYENTGWHNNNDGDILISFTATDICYGINQVQVDVYKNDIFNQTLSYYMCGGSTTCTGQLNYFPDQDRTKYEFIARAIDNDSRVSEDRASDPDGTDEFRASEVPFFPEFSDDDDGDSNPVTGIEWSESWVDQGIPQQAVINSPPACTIEPLITWSIAQDGDLGSGIQSQTLQIATDPLFNSIVVNRPGLSKDTSEYQITPSDNLQNNMRYYARITSFDNAGNQGNSSTRTWVILVGSCPWIQTLQGDVHSTESILGGEPAPGNLKNATFLLSAEGQIVRWKSEFEQSEPGKWQLDQYDPPLGFPGDEGSVFHEPNIDELISRSKQIPTSVISGTYNLGQSCSLDGIPGNESFCRIHYRAGYLRLNYAKFTNGAGTIIVDGDLILEGGYASSYLGSLPAKYQSKEALPNVGFIVLGNVIIDSQTQNVVGNFYVPGDGTPNSGKVIVQSSNRGLQVGGLMIARKFEFLRTYWGDDNNNGVLDPPTETLQPAEKILYDARVAVNTPPGFEEMITAVAGWNEVRVAE